MWYTCSPTRPVSLHCTVLCACRDIVYHLQGYTEIEEVKLAVDRVDCSEEGMEVPRPPPQLEAAMYTHRVANDVMTISTCLNSLFKAMHEGWFSQWVECYFTDDCLLTVSGKLDDPSEDRSCVGKQNLVLYYNNVLEKVWGGSCATVNWTVDDIQVKGPKVETLFTMNIVRETGVASTKRRMFTLGLNDEQSHLSTLRVSAAVAEDDMDEELVCCRCCVPPAVPTPQEVEESKALLPFLFDPCHHNTWDSIRVKRKWCLLRCRTCRKQWRLIASSISRCIPFITSGCTLGPKCPKLHIFLRKQRSNETTTGLPPHPAPAT
eukprot:TRINITY_DN9453_c0_g1_i1.p1 TRINITY_DN9453_c0_g1~~TRINITY_DN9453_c0_g1_i1.p1  ORF type:complete len:320 (+),score=63.56 TRINITY_DN9453_c0_g1_i1:525-1484(+)